jgi:hypothetical protein
VQVTLRGEVPAVPGVAQVIAQSRNGGNGGTRSATPGSGTATSGTATSGTATSGNYHLLLEDGVAPEAVLKALVQAPAVTVESFAQIRPSLDEIFVRVVGHREENEVVAS